MPSPGSRQWSDDLRAATRQALHDVPATADGRLHMKQIDGGYGWFQCVDLIAGTFELHRKDRDGSVSFADAGAVVAAGWAID